MTIEKSIQYSLALLIIVLGFVAVFRIPGAQQALGSVIQGNEYSSKTFATTNVVGASTTVGVLRYGGGSLAQVTVTGSGGGSIDFYNATTSCATCRDASQATSSILIATINAGVTGTFTFDVAYSRGLFMDVVGAMPTTTVTYR